MKFLTFFAFLFGHHSSGGGEGGGLRSSVPAVPANPMITPTAVPTTSPTAPTTSPTLLPTSSPTTNPTASCSSHSDCPDSDQSDGMFCEPILHVCLPKRPNGVQGGCDGVTPGIDGDAMCQSGICVTSACQPCRNIFRNDACDDDQHCAFTMSGSGLTNHYCRADKKTREVCVENDECKNGKCVKLLVGADKYCN